MWVSTIFQNNVFKLNAPLCNLACYIAYATYIMPQSQIGLMRFL